MVTAETLRVSAVTFITRTDFARIRLCQHLNIFLQKNRSLEAIEHERLIRHFEKGTCPYRESPVSEIRANDHLGFCNERHLHCYQVKHSTYVRLDYQQTHGRKLHEQYLENMVKELSIPVELFRKPHDEDHKSLAEIRAEIAGNKDQQAA